MKILDLTGLRCPMPLIETKKALKQLVEEDVLKIIIDNETSLKNVTHYLKDNGIPASHQQKGNVFEIKVNMPEGVAFESPDPALWCEPENPGNNFVVFFSKDRIGEGSEELGNALVGAMLNTLKATGRTPQKMLFMNSGINLVVNGSLFLNQLKEFQENGVDLIVCGTCLDYFGKMDDLAVGRVSNMLEILEAILSAPKVVNI
jgi:selenium metabolism protein YedF